MNLLTAVAFNILLKHKFVALITCQVKNGFFLFMLFQNLAKFFKTFLDNRLQVSAKDFPSVSGELRILFLIFLFSFLLLAG
jgi:hypothetical protein